MSFNAFLYEMFFFSVSKSVCDGNTCENICYNIENVHTENETLRIALLMAQRIQTNNNGNKLIRNDNNRIKKNYIYKEKMLHIEYVRL